MQPFPRKPGRPPAHPNEGGAQRKYTVMLTPAQHTRVLQFGPTVSAGINNILRNMRPDPADATVASGNRDEFEANTRLIESAPDLLKALRRALRDAEKGGFSLQTFDDVRAAIARATGAA